MIYLHNPIPLQVLIHRDSIYTFTHTVHVLYVMYNIICMTSDSDSCNHVHLQLLLVWDPELEPGVGTRNWNPELEPGVGTRTWYPDLVPGPSTRTWYPDLVPGPGTWYPDLVPGLGTQSELVGHLFIYFVHSYLLEWLV